MPRACRYSILFMLALLLSGCSLPGQDQVAPPAATNIPIETSSIPTATEPPTPVIPTSLPELTEAILKSAAYQGTLFPEPFTLIDGQYQAGEGADLRSVTMLPQLAYGDLNQDGFEDAAVLLAENGGGSGVFVSLVAVLNENGQPQQAGITLVDDRPLIHSLTIQGGVILLDATIHRVSDAMVSPTLLVNQTFRLGDNGLHMAALTSPTDGGTTRQITITSPAWGDQTGDSLQVTGEMPIGPFENNLLYRIIDAAGQEFAAGPFPVRSDGVGGPATFDNLITLPQLPAGSVIWLELSENSMMDGSPLAVSRVMLVFKP